MAVIAISGKGGSGKTTISACLIRLLIENSHTPILAVDADPNSCLGMACGIEPETTISVIRDTTRTQKGGGSSGKIRSFEYGIQQAVTEAKGFDLVTMGRPEGPDCYCAVNNVLRTFLSNLSGSYKSVIVDNEAGMEHLSRRTTNNVDLLAIVAEPTTPSVVTVERICSLAKELPIVVKRMGVIWNRTDNTKTLDGIETLGCVPYNKVLFDASVQGKTIFDIDAQNPAVSAMRNIVKSKFDF